MPSGVSHIVE